MLFSWYHSLFVCFLQKENILVAELFFFFLIQVVRSANKPLMKEIKTNNLRSQRSCSFFFLYLQFLFCLQHTCVPSSTSFFFVCVFFFFLLFHHSIPKKKKKIIIINVVKTIRKSTISVIIKIYFFIFFRSLLLLVCCFNKNNCVFVFCLCAISTKCNTDLCHPLLLLPRLFHLFGFWRMWRLFFWDT